MVQRRQRVRAPEVPSMDRSPAGSGLADERREQQGLRRSRRSAQLAEAEGLGAATSPKNAPVRLTEDPSRQDAVAAPPAKRRPRSGVDPVESKARAKARAAEILQHDIGMDEDDKFYVPLEIIPDDWKYMWRRKSTYGKEDPQYMVKIAQTGWTPVPADRHPEMMPSTGGPYLTIEREGMVLMEIPMEVYRLLEAKEQRKAIEQVRIKTAQLGMAPPGTFARDQHQKNMPSVRHSYEPLIVPD